MSIANKSFGSARENINKAALAMEIAASKSLILGAAPEGIVAAIRGAQTKIEKLSAARVAENRARLRAQHAGPADCKPFSEPHDAAGV